MINVAVVGCGYWGPNLIRNVSQIDSTNLHTVCDLDESKLQKIKSLYPKVNVTKNFEDLLKNKEIDAIVVATFPSTHYPLGKKVLESGKHVFIEKPLALNSRDAKELVDLAKRQKKILMVGHTFEYTPAVNKLKELIESNELGEIFYLYTQRLNLGLFQRDTNVVWDLGPHDVSILLYILQKMPVAVSAFGNCHIQKNVEDVAFINLKMSNGTVCHIHVSWLDPNKIRKTVVVGSKKMVEYNDIEPMEKIKIFDKSASKPDASGSFGEWLISYNYGDITVPKLSSAEPLRIELSHFAECIEKNQKPRSDGESGLRVVKVLEAAVKSIKNNGAEIKIEELKK